MNMSLSKIQETAKDREALCAAVYGVTKNRTWLSDWILTTKPISEIKVMGIVWFTLEKSHFIPELQWKLRTKSARKEESQERLHHWAACCCQQLGFKPLQNYVLSWPRKSLRVSHNILQKNQNESLGQLNTLCLRTVPLKDRSWDTYPSLVADPAQGW